MQEEISRALAGSWFDAGGIRTRVVERRPSEIDAEADELLMQVVRDGRIENACASVLMLEYNFEIGHWRPGPVASVLEAA